MALSPEDVIKKEFSPTRLRQGYEETQVDDFLDQVVVELRRLLAENDRLRSDLEDCRAARGEGGDGAVSTDAHVLVGGPVVQDGAEPEGRSGPGDVDGADGIAEGAGVPEVEDLRLQLSACQQARADLEQRLAQAEQRAQEAEQRGAGGPGQPEDQDRSTPQSAGSDAEDPSSIISLAQRLHDQHVAEGESTRARLVEEGQTFHDEKVGAAEQRSAELTRTGQETHDRLVQEGQETHDRLVQEGQQTHDRLVQEGQETRDRLVGEGQSRHDELVQAGEQTRDQVVGDAEQQRSSILADLSSQQGTLTGRITALQTQESDLRDRLRAFLTDQLSKVEGTTQR